MKEEMGENCLHDVWDTDRTVYVVPSSVAGVYVDDTWGNFNLPVHLSDRKKAIVVCDELTVCPISYAYLFYVVFAILAVSNVYIIHIIGISFG